METSIKNFIRTYEDFPLALACSGGVDSVALLHALAHSSLKSRLAVFHVHHNQHAMAARAQTLVEGLAARYELPYYTARLEVGPGQSEAALRKLRHEAFRAFIRDFEPDARVALAHHADDQLETLLFRILRGAHPTSLKPMAKAAAIAGLHLVRPLLDVPKAEITAYAQRHKLSYIEDPTNQDTRFARNAIRLKLIPLLEELRPHGAEKLRRFLEDVSQCINLESPPSEELVSKLRAGETIALSALDHAPLRPALVVVLGELADQVVRRQWENLEKALQRAKVSGEKKLIEFPGGSQIVIHKKALRFLRSGT